MVDLPSKSQFSCVVRDPAVLIYNVEIAQVPGTNDQLMVSFSFPQSLVSGTFYARFISNYNGTDGKQEVEAAGGFQIAVQVQALGSSANSVTVLSQPGLAAGTTYQALIYWVSDSYASAHWLGADGEVYPPQNALVVSAPLTIQQSIQSPTNILPDRLVVTQGTAAGALLGTLSADITGCDFAEQPGTDLALVDVAANGQVTIASGQGADTVGQFVLKARADNTALGGGTFDKDIVVDVQAAGSGTGGAGEIPMPVVNTEVAGSVAALQSVLASLETNWAGTMAAYGLSSADEPVIGLAAGQHGDLTLAGLDFTGRGRVTIRGIGAFDRDAWAPVAGTHVGKLTFSNSHNIRVMGLEAEVSSGNHGFANSTFCQIVRCVIMDRIARDLATAATRPQVSSVFLLNGSSDCSILHCAILGGQARQIGAVKTSNTRIRIEGNVFDQAGGDNVNINAGTNNNWELHNNLAAPRGRSPGGIHQDLVQVFATGGAVATATGWSCTGNVCITNSTWGSETHAANQMFFWGGGSSNSNGTFTDNIAGNTNGMVKGSHGGATARFNTQGMCANIPQAEATTYSASWGGINGQNVDENIVPQKSGGTPTGAGANGLHMLMQNSSYLENPANDWSAQLGIFDRQIMRGDTIGMLRPKAGSRYDWNHSDPTGAFQCARRLFDPASADHWKLWGWPVAPMAHISTDPGNELAGASGTYQNFDANGAYLG